MSLGKRLFTEGAAACLTETTDIFGNSSGKALYSMDYDASDASGSYNATPTNIEFGVSGKTVNGARFNGSSSEIGLPVGLGASGDRAFSFWMKLIALPTSGTDTIIYIGNQSQNSQYTTININSSGTVRYQERHNTTGGDSTNDLLIESSTNISINQWVHIVIVFDGTTRNFYLNGSTSNGGTGTKVGGAADTSSFAGQFGSFRGVGGTFTLDGTIDQARFFSAKITPTQVATLYNSGNGETACVHTSTTDTVNFPSGTTNAAYLKMDNSAKDEVSGNTGSDTNVQYRFGKYNQSAFFNDTGIINTGFTRSGTSFSVSLWLNLNDNGTRQLFLADGDTNGANSSITFSAQVDASDRVIISVNDGDSGYHANDVVSYVGKYNKWTHFVVTLNGTSGAVYLDNSKTTFTSSRSLGSAAQAFAIGSWGVTANNGGETDGFIDQVRFYNAQLSDANVTSLYNEKPETDTSNFKTVSYIGNGGTQYISNVGMDLETDGGLVWVKNRNATGNHSLIDSVRGVSKPINSNATNTEQNYPNFTLTSFEENGFFVTDDSNGLYGFNGAPGGTYGGTTGGYVGWVWKGGGAAVSNGNGSITSSVSANTAAGFSIVSWTGNGTGATIGHGLSAKPELILMKARTRTNNWGVYAEDITADKFLVLNDNAIESNSSTAFDNTEPTSSIFTVGSSLSFNNSGTMIAYCFHSVSGYSKIATYVGNNSSTNQITGVGFKPSFLMIKKISNSGTGHWMVYDNRRDTTNAPQTDTCLFWNLNDGDFSASDINISFDSDGFTLKGNNSNINGASPLTYLYMAII